MSLTLSEFTADVRAALGRGTALDTVIPAKIRQAVRAIEQNVEPGYVYMKKFASSKLNSSATYPHIVDVPSPRMKALLMFRLLLDDGSYKYLKKIEPEDVSFLDTAEPSGYWLAGQGKLYLDAKPDEDYTVEMLWIEYSAWSSDDDFTHWLLDNAEALLFNWTMCLMAPWIRDARMLETFRNDRDEAVRLLECSKIDMETANMSVDVTFGG